MKLYNTLTGQEEEFVPADGNTVKMYICGVTPYSSTHVGHALSYVVFDVLRRYLEHIGYQVQHIQNFTDVDDKIILRARSEGISEDTLTERYIDDFFSTMDALNIQRAHAYPRATQEIPGIIKTIKGLVDQGYAYPVNGNVYFRVEQKHVDLTELVQGLLEERVYTGSVRDVGRYGQRTRPDLSDHFSYLFDGTGSSRGDHQVGAGPGHRQDHLPPESGAAAGNDDGLAVQAKVFKHCSPFSKRLALHL